MFGDVRLSLPSCIQETSSGRLRGTSTKQQIAGSKGFQIGAKLSQRFPQLLQVWLLALLAALEPGLPQITAEMFGRLSSLLGTACLEEHRQCP